MAVCACGCGEETAGGVYRPGHDQKLRTALEERTGGLLRLARLVDAAEAYSRGDARLEDLGTTARALIPRPRSRSRA